MIRMSRIDQRNVFSVNLQFLADPSAFVDPDVIYCCLSYFVYSCIFDVDSVFVAILFLFIDSEKHRYTQCENFLISITVFFNRRLKEYFYFV